MAFEEGAKGRLGAVVFEKCVLEGDVNAQTAVGTGEMESIECDLAVCAVGYTASPPCPDGGRAVPQAGPAGTYAQVGGVSRRGSTARAGSNAAPPASSARTSPTRARRRPPCSRTWLLVVWLVMPRARGGPGLAPDRYSGEGEREDGGAARGADVGMLAAAKSSRMPK